MLLAEVDHAPSIVITARTMRFLVFTSLWGHKATDLLWPGALSLEQDACSSTLLASFNCSDRAQLKLKLTK